ncbi:hypothetical protein HDU96_003901 [Phlyctochytrium bullatum]|nr:hypothetical protein HDU96_003901 [Phlyctochytrium bullatum]
MRESKKIFSRVWLVIINLIAFLLSIGITTLGVLTLVWANTASQSVDVNGAADVNVEDVKKAVYDMLRIIGWALAIYGAFILLTSLFGMIGGCTRNEGVLSCYISTVVVDILLTIGVAIYACVTLLNKKKEWEDMSEATWKGYTDSQKYFYQVQFRCCGFNANQSFPYLGQPIFKDVDFSCAANNYTTVPGCQTAATDFYKRMVLYDGVGAGVIFIILLTCVGAAHQARRAFYLQREPAAQPMVVGVVRY